MKYKKIEGKAKQEGRKEIKVVDERPQAQNGGGNVGRCLRANKEEKLRGQATSNVSSCC